MILLAKRNVRRLFRVAALLLSALLLCSSCRATLPEGEDTESVFVTDALGRELSVPRQPSRVASLIGSFSDVWLLAGGSLCASVEDAWEDFGLELGDAVNLGGAHSPSLELLLAAEPELVLASASTASNLAMRESLETMGIDVIYFDVDHFNDYLQMLDVCTEITGRRDLFEQNGLALQGAIEAIKAQYAALELPSAEKRILLLRASSTTVKAKGSRGTVLGEMLADMGCINIADNDDTLLESLSVEAVLANEPHHVFVVTMGSDTAAAEASLRALIEGNPAWRSLEAVSEGRLHLMDKKLFNLKPNASWAEAYQRLYETLINH